MPFLSSSYIPIGQFLYTNFYEQFYDGTLRTDDGSTFHIHRVLLAQRSDYFRSLFSFEDKGRTEILVKGIGSEILRQILQYLYDGDLYLNENNVCGLMIASDYMLLDDIMQQCCEFAIRHMTPNNCLKFLTIAARYERCNIFRECSRYAKLHFEKIVKKFPEEIGDLPIEVLTHLLKDNALNVNSEYTVWMAIVIWIKVDPFNRNQHVPGLLPCIRSKEIDGLLALQVMPNLFHIATNSLQVLPNISGPLFLQTNLYTETVNRLPKYLHVSVSCSWIASQSGMSYEIHLTYDEEMDFWRKIGDVSYFPDAILAIGIYIYLFNTWDNVILRYDLLDEFLVPITGIAHRYCYCIVELNQKIYALGGLTEFNETTNTMECYDPDNDTWYPINQGDTMIISDAVAMHGKMYVLGHNEDGSNMVMRVYDPITDAWNTTESARVLRRGFSAVAFENHLYVIGGENIDGGLKSVEEYDPVLEVWTSLPDLPFLYFIPKAVIVAGRIVVFDNYHEDARFIEVSPAVCWDSVKRTWQVIDRSLPFYSIERYRFGILDDPNVVRELVSGSRRSTVQWVKIFLSNEN